MATAHEVFEAYSKTVYEFFNDNPALIIPSYQRAYSWDKEQLYSLIGDSIEGLGAFYDRNKPNRNNRMTYIGTIIVSNGYDSARQYGFINPPDPCLLIIDGQQRITSIVITAIGLIRAIASVLGRLKILEGESSSLGSIRSVAEMQLAKLFQLVKVQNRPFVRVIRLANDIWREPESQYKSTIAYVSDQLIKARESSVLEKFAAKRPQNQPRSFEFSRIEDWSKALQAFLRGDDSRTTFLDNIPTCDEIKLTTDASEILFGSKVDFDFDRTLLSEGDVDLLNNFVRLIVFVQYFLTRVAFTKVKGLSEDSAFDVFDSLNTTGEPLNAYETLKPQILRQIPPNLLATSPESEIFEQIEAIAQYGKKTVKLRQKLYNDTIILFSLADKGAKIGRSLSAQTAFLRYVGAISDRRERELTVSFFRECLEFSSNFSLSEYYPQTFFNLLDAEAKLSFEFLKQIKHTLALAPLACAYHLYCRGDLGHEDLSRLTKALGAFAILWRAARGGTGGIDGVLRDLMTGGKNLTNLDALKRDSKHVLNVSSIQSELLARLFSYKTGNQVKLDNKAGWISATMRQPLAEQHHVAKMLLLAAQHDAIASSVFPGLVERGVEGVSRALTLDHFKSEESFSIEHICPQSFRNTGWSDTFSADIHAVHYIGNLVLLPLPHNTMASNNSWEVKRQFYRALSRRSIEEKEAEINNVLLSFLSADSKEKVRLASFFAPLEAISAFAHSWDTKIVDQRSRCLLDLAFDRFERWLR